MAGLNKCMIIGNLGRDVELKYSQSGVAVGRIAVATSDSWTDAQGQKQEKTEWYNVTVFGKTAENCEKYLKKGSKVFVEGKLQTDSYDKEGQTHYSTKIIANVVQFLDSKDSGAGTGQQGGYNPQPKAQPQQGYQPSPQQQKINEQMGEEIPF
jgi:single-strand DNA-binding protein